MNLLLQLGLLVAIVLVNKTAVSQVVINLDNTTLKAQLAPASLTIKPRANKTYYWYKSNSIQSSEEGIGGTLLNGSYRVFDLEKNLLEQGQFKKGLKSGQWKNWYEDGTLKSKVCYKRGEQNGRYAYYDRNGNVTEQGKVSKSVLLSVFRKKNKTEGQKMNNTDQKETSEDLLKENP